MTTGAWIVVGVLLAAILGGGTYMLISFLHNIGAFRKWRKVGPWYVSGPVTDEHFLDCMTAAELALKVPPGTFRDLAVLVWDTPTVIYNDRKVSGLTAGKNDISVGSDLSGLCHEMVHVLELRTNGKTTLDHDTEAWLKPGGWYAKISTFEAWWAKNK